MKNYKRICAALLSAILLLGALMVTSAVTTPIAISSVNDLMDFVKSVQNNPQLDAQLTNDIDLAGYAWTPISNYAGTFDGK